MSYCITLIFFLSTVLVTSSVYGRRFFCYPIGWMCPQHHLLNIAVCCEPARCVSIETVKQTYSVTKRNISYTYYRCRIPNNSTEGVHFIPPVEANTESSETVNRTHRNNFTSYDTSSVESKNISEEIQTSNIHEWLRKLEEKIQKQENYTKNYKREETGSYMEDTLDATNKLVKDLININRSLPMTDSKEDHSGTLSKYEYLLKSKHFFQEDSVRKYENSRSRIQKRSADLDEHHSEEQDRTAEEKNHIVLKILEKNNNHTNSEKHSSTFHKSSTLRDSTISDVKNVGSMEKSKTKHKEKRTQKRHKKVNIRNEHEMEMVDSKRTFTKDQHKARKTNTKLRLKLNLTFNDSEREMHLKRNTDKNDYVHQNKNGTTKLKRVNHRNKLHKQKRREKNIHEFSSRKGTSEPENKKDTTHNIYNEMRVVNNKTNTHDVHMENILKTETTETAAAEFMTHNGFIHHIATEMSTHVVGHNNINTNAVTETLTNKKHIDRSKLNDSGFLETSTFKVITSTVHSKLGKILNHGNPEDINVDVIPTQMRSENLTIPVVNDILNELDVTTKPKVQRQRIGSMLSRLFRSKSTVEGTTPTTLSTASYYTSKSPQTNIQTQRNVTRSILQEDITEINPPFVVNNAMNKQTAGVYELSRGNENFTIKSTDNIVTKLPLNGETYQKLEIQNEITTINTYVSNDVTNSENIIHNNEVVTMKNVVQNEITASENEENGIAITEKVKGNEVTDAENIAQNEVVVENFRIKGTTFVSVIQTETTASDNVRLEATTMGNVYTEETTFENILLNEVTTFENVIHSEADPAADNIENEIHSKSVQNELTTADSILQKEITNENSQKEAATDETILQTEETMSAVNMVQTDADISTVEGAIQNEVTTLDSMIQREVEILESTTVYGLTKSESIQNEVTLAENMPQNTENVVQNEITKDENNVENEAISSETIVPNEITASEKSEQNEITAFENVQNEISTVGNEKYEITTATVNEQYEMSAAAESIMQSDVTNVENIPQSDLRNYEDTDDKFVNMSRPENDIKNVQQIDSTVQTVEQNLSDNLTLIPDTQNENDISDGNLNRLDEAVQSGVGSLDEQNYTENNAIAFNVIDKNSITTVPPLENGVNKADILNKIEETKTHSSDLGTNDETSETKPNKNKTVYESEILNTTNFNVMNDSGMKEENNIRDGIMINETNFEKDLTIQNLNTQQEITTENHMNEEITEIATENHMNEEIIDIATENHMNEEITEIATENHINEEITEIATENHMNEEITDIATENHMTEEITEIVTENHMTEEITEIATENHTNEEITEIATENFMNEEITTENHMNEEITEIATENHMNEEMTEITTENFMNIEITEITTENHMNEEITEIATENHMNEEITTENHTNEEITEIATENRMNEEITGSVDINEVTISSKIAENAVTADQTNSTSDSVAISNENSHNQEYLYENRSNVSEEPLMGAGIYQNDSESIVHEVLPIPESLRVNISNLDSNSYNNDSHYQDEKSSYMGNSLDGHSEKGSVTSDGHEGSDGNHNDQVYSSYEHSDHNQNASKSISGLPSDGSPDSGSNNTHENSFVYDGFDNGEYESNTNKHSSDNDVHDDYHSANESSDIHDVLFTESSQIGHYQSENESNIQENHYEHNVHNGYHDSENASNVQDNLSTHYAQNTNDSHGESYGYEEHNGDYQNENTTDTYQPLVHGSDMYSNNYLYENSSDVSQLPYTDNVHDQNLSRNDIHEELHDYNAHGENKSNVNNSSIYDHEELNGNKNDIHENLNTENGDNHSVNESVIHADVHDSEWESHTLNDHYYQNEDGTNVQKQSHENINNTLEDSFVADDKNGDINGNLTGMAFVDSPHGNNNYINIVNRSENGEALNDHVGLDSNNAQGNGIDVIHESTNGSETSSNDEYQRLPNNDSNIYEKPNDHDVYHHGHEEFHDGTSNVHSNTFGNDEILHNSDDRGLHETLYTNDSYSNIQHNSTYDMYDDEHNLNAYSHDNNSYVHKSLHYHDDYDGYTNSSDDHYAQQNNHEHSNNYGNENNDLHENFYEHDNYTDHVDHYNNNNASEHIEMPYDHNEGVYHDNNDYHTGQENLNYDDHGNYTDHVGNYNDNNVTEHIGMPYDHNGGEYRDNNDYHNGQENLNYDDKEGYHNETAYGDEANHHNESNHEYMDNVNNEDYHTDNADNTHDMGNTENTENTDNLGDNNDMGNTDNLYDNNDMGKTDNTDNTNNADNLDNTDNVDRYNTDTDNTYRDTNTYSNVGGQTPNINIPHIINDFLKSRGKDDSSSEDDTSSEYEKPKPAKKKVTRKKTTQQRFRKSAVGTKRTPINRSNNNKKNITTLTTTTATKPTVTTTVKPSESSTTTKEDVPPEDERSLAIYLSQNKTTAIPLLTNVVEIHPWTFVLNTNVETMPLNLSSSEEAALHH